MKYEDLPEGARGDAAQDYGGDHIGKLDWTVEMVSPDILLSPIYSVEREKPTAWTRHQWVHWFWSELRDEYTFNEKGILSAAEGSKFESPDLRCHELLGWWPGDVTNISFIILQDGISWVLDGHHRLVVGMIKGIDKIPVVIGRP